MLIADIAVADDGRKLVTITRHETPIALVMELCEHGDWRVAAAYNRDTDQRVALPPCFSPSDEVLQACDEMLVTLDA